MVGVIEVNGGGPVAFHTLPAAAGASESEYQRADISAGASAGESDSSVLDSCPFSGTLNFHILILCRHKRAPGFLGYDILI